MDPLNFYQSFIDFLNFDHASQMQSDIKDKFLSQGFRAHLRRSHVDAQLTKEVAPYLARMAKKPQRVLLDEKEYYIAIDLATRTHYICYKRLMMIDIDICDGDTEPIENRLPHCKCQIDAILEEKKKIEPSTVRASRWHLYKCKKESSNCIFRYRIYKSRNGYHAFLISHFMDYKSDLALQLMNETLADYFYIVFSYLRGWCVRLNPKSNEIVESKSIYSLVGDCINGEIISNLSNDNNVISLLSKFVDLHVNLCEVFSNS